jgi:hypothetical protein
MYHSLWPLCLIWLYIFFVCHITYTKKGQIHNYIFCFYKNTTKDPKCIILKYFHVQVGGIFHSPITTSVLIMFSGDCPVALTTEWYLLHMTVKKWLKECRKGIVCQACSTIVTLQLAKVAYSIYQHACCMIRYVNKILFLNIGITPYLKF